MFKKSIHIVALILLILASSSFSESQEINIYVNQGSLSESAIKFDVKTFINSDNRTLVPMNFFSEILGYDVTWNKIEYQAEISNDQLQVILPINTNSSFVNNVEKTFDTMTIIKDGKIFVPLRFISETFGAEIKYRNGRDNRSNGQVAHIIDINIEEKTNGGASNKERTLYGDRFIKKLQNGDKTTIVFLGDSTTELNTTTGSNPNHVGLLNVWLEESYASQVTVINSGISGQTIEQMHSRLFKDVLKYNPDLIVINSGLNDYGGTLAISLTKYENIYNQMIQEIISNTESDIIIRTSNPTLNPKFNDGLRDYNLIAYSISLKYRLGFFDLYSEMEEDINNGNIVHKQLMNDTIHPNALGHYYIFEKFKKYFINSK